MPTPQRGDLDPQRWLEEHGNALYGFALSRLRNPSVAEDLVQDTFLAAFKGKERFSGRSSERTWLTGILKHKVIDYYRKSAREKLYEDAETMESVEHERFEPGGHWRTGPSPWTLSPAKSYERKEFWDVLQACLAGLQPRHQAAFSLREIDGLDGDEICKVLGISESNLWVILHRARLKLRDCMAVNWFQAAEEGSA